MLYKPFEGEEGFEVSLYITHVRSLVKKIQGNEIFEDHWADSPKFHVVASDENEARRVVSGRFKFDDVFVTGGELLTAF